MNPDRPSRGEGEDSKKRKMRSFGAPAAEILRLDFSKLGEPATAQPIEDRLVEARRVVKRLNATVLFDAPPCTETAGASQPATAPAPPASICRSVSTAARASSGSRAARTSASSGTRRAGDGPGIALLLAGPHPRTRHASSPRGARASATEPAS